MEQERPIPTERLRTVRDQMVERFSLSELRDLCFELGLNWDQLAGDTLDGKAIALLERLNRQARLPALLARLHVLHPDVAWELDDLDESAAPPYKGLAYYDRADARLFFGRERLIARLLTSLRGLRQQSFLAVVGKSGSGKSSLVRAGLIPTLRGERPPPQGAALPDGSPRWAYLEMTPTDRPLEQLAVTLTRDLTTAGETRAILQDLQADPATASLYLRKYLDRRRASRAFLLVDQFEELYTAGKDETARAAFITALLDVAEAGLTTVVITLRADFLHRFLDNTRLRDALQRHQELIGAMDAAELREAIERPALATGYELEPGLVEVIVGDTGQDAGALPLLSHALLETWRRREGWRLTHAGYNAAGGVGGAIAKTAERAYADLDPPQQAIARRVFLELTELGEGAEDTRRSVPLADLLPGNPAERAAAEAVLDGLYRARLVTADESQAQVTHEALIREWPALREWLKDEREALRLERRLRAAAGEWDAGGRDASYLYDGAQLAAACQWAAHAPRVTGTVRAFLDAATVEEGREAAERERAQQEKLAQAQRLAEEADKRAEAEADTARTFKRWATIAGILLVVAVAVAGVAIALRNQAVRATGDAQARLLQNHSATTFESDPLLANRLLLEAMAVAGNETARDEAADALADHLRAGRTTMPITGTSVIGFHGVHTNTLYVVDYQLGNDSLISGATGAPITSLSGNFSSVESIPNSSSFIIDYFNVSDELRQTDNTELVIPLVGEVVKVDHIRNSNSFIVTYFDEPGELRRTDDAYQVLPLNGIIDTLIIYPHIPYFSVIYSDSSNSAELRRADDAYQVFPLKFPFTVRESRSTSPYFIIDYSEATDELRRTDDAEQVIPLVRDDASGLESIPDSPFFVVTYFTEPGELRRADDEYAVVPLSGRVDRIYPIPNSPFFVIDYFAKPGELRRTDDIEHFITLRGEVVDIPINPNSPFFVVRYAEEPGELYRTDDINQVVLLADKISFVRFISDNLVIINYIDEPDELRWGDDFEKIVTLSGEVSDSRFIPDTSFFIVGYSGNTLGELRRIDEPGQIIPLNGRVSTYQHIIDSPLFFIDYFGRLGELRRIDDVEKVIPLNHMDSRMESIPDSPFLIVSYFNLPAELRWTDTGEVVTDENGQRMAESATVLRAGAGYYWLRYQDGTSAIASTNHGLVDLGQGVEQSLYFPETNRVAVRYGDGRVVYIDLDLIEALGGADAAKKLDAMSLDELIAFTCKTLFTDNPEWDEAKLEAYLADILPEWEAKACG